MANKKRWLWIVLPLATASLFSCSGQPFQDSDFINKIFPNGYWDFLIQLIAFVILLLLVFFIGYKPVKKMLQKRHDAVNAMIEDAKANQAVAKKAAEESAQVIAEGKEEAQRIVETAKRQAELSAQAILAKAKEDAAIKRQRAEEEIEDAKRASKEEVRQQIVDVAMLASKTLLGREVSSADNARLIEDFVDEMKEE